MHRSPTHKKKSLAFFFLIVLTVETFYPGISYAITSGPAQPEMQKFEPAGTNDMVDLFSGDFKYNIPLLDVGGYPVNLAYQSGTGMEDEATWVGTGWSLNPGAVNRTMRGLPDDFNGEKGDKISKEYNKKEFKKVGGKIVIKPSAFAHELGKASVSLNIYKDNYYGIGASFGASVGFSSAKNASGTLTAGMGLDLNSDVRDGASITPNLSLSMESETNGENNSGSLSGGFSYNTRSGLKSVDLGASFSTTNAKGRGFATSGSAVHYFGQTYSPSIQNSINNDQKSLNFDIGPSIFGGYLGVGGGGYYYHETIEDKITSVPAFGYMNYLSGRSKSNALLDFNREKDGVYIPGMPSIAVPVATQDYFMASGQTGTQQFRPFYSGNYVVSDRTFTNKTFQGGLGVTIGAGNAFKGGGRIDATVGQTQTKKWTSGNGNVYLNSAEASFNSTPGTEIVYFKQSGEPTKADEQYYNKLGSNRTQKVKLNGSNSSNQLVSRGGANPPIYTVNMNRENRDVRVSGFNYLNADMATKYGLDKKIKSYKYNSSNTTPSILEANRVNGDKKGHHISEITTVSADGQRSVYGIPVYNNTQIDCSFAIVAPSGNDEKNGKQSGIIGYNNTDASPSNKNGRDWMYSKEQTPGYATSYLLTGVLSPDYVDLTNNGITDDDLGTAVKFNYGKLLSTSSSTDEFQWRAPYDGHMANYNEGYLSDKKDDKASFTYGKKEIWNLASIESKTMIAIFRTSAREDGLGVADINGGKNTDFRLKKLDSIQLYSKADWLAAIQSHAIPTPIKVVHFEYDYSLYPNMPNNTGESAPIPIDPYHIQCINGIGNGNCPTKETNAAKGKLTLKKVYFTFGKSSRGITNPYEFEYDLTLIRDANGTIPAPLTDPQHPQYTDTYAKEFNDDYTQRQSDRWGTYRQSWYVSLLGPTASSPCIPAGSPRLNNSDFPYALQKNAPPENINNATWSALIDRMASKWQLNTITTPSGGRIKVQYESDDYAYVQNRRAMQMCFISGITSAGNCQGLARAQDLVVDLPVSIGTDPAELRQKYLQGVDKVFYKVFTDIDGRGHYEFVHGYASIDINNCHRDNSDPKKAVIRLVMLNGYNPIAKGAWQTLKSDLPQYAYDNYDNSEVGDVTAAIKSLITSFTNLREFFQPFEKHAENSGFANRIYLPKSMIRLCCPDMRKTGGGLRVKSLTISDEWQTMTQGQTTGTVNTAKYGQSYDYTIKDNNGNVVSSSGVAAYEPQIGNEENPFHEPVNYTEKVYWSSDRNHFVEKPYCESYFPSASVGYSKVTVTSIGNNNSGETGYIENEFYTAKDFPTIVDDLPLDQNKYESSMIIQLFASTSIQRMAVSQGFKIELNDMHGKPKSIKVHNQAKDIISQTDYSYNVEDDNAEVKQLKNSVDILQKDGSILPNTTVGTDIDFISDVRESNSEQIGGSVGAYAGGMVVPLAIVIIYFPYVSVSLNASVSSNTFRSVCAVKVIHRSGILKKVKTMQNGSVLTTENLLWDGQTGEVLLTKAQNEYDDYTYSFNYPAYMAYEGMGEAYKNIGTVINDFSTDATGFISPSNISYLYPGDELVAINNNLKGWVIRSDDSKLRLIDANGDFIYTSGSFMILRSGRRNMLNASAGTVVLMKDPRENNRLNLGVDKKVLDAKAVLYNEQWNVPVTYCSTCPAGYQLSPEGQCVKDVAATYNAPSYEVCAADPNIAYTSCGSYIYTFYDGSISSFTRSRISTTNSFWVGSPSAQSQQCGYTPLLTTQYYPRPGGNQNITVATNYDSTVRRPNSTTNASFGFDGPLNRCGIWTCPTGNYSPIGQWIGFSRTITVPTSKQYYIGLGADDRFRLKIDGQLIVQRLIQDGENYRLWHIFPVMLSAGQHIIEMDGWNSGSVASFGAEIYDNTASEIEIANSYAQLNLIFSTKDLIGQAFQTGVYTCPTDYALNTGTSPYSCRSIVTPGAQTGSSSIINPYYTGLLGNWRPQTNFLYTVNRTQTAGLVSQTAGTDLRRSGAYSTYTPFWNFVQGDRLRNNQFTQAPGAFDIPTPADNRWVWANQSVYFDKKGNEVESRDALNRYGSALYGYAQSVATAIAANTRHNELAFEGFEDYNFSLGDTSSCTAKRQLDWGLQRNVNTWSNSAGGIITAEKAHTGRYSFKLNGSTNTINASAGAANPTAPFLDFNGNHQYRLLANEQSGGFAPIPQKKYVLSFWVSEDGNANPTSNKVQKLTLRINNVDQDLQLKPTYVVEGWKRVEAVFTTPPNTVGSNFQLDLVPNGVIYIDDVRVLPFDGQLNSYVYDPLSMRLMAQLDENNFATLYEYDDEGTLIRVKKETEKGIITLKENRQSLRKRQ